MKLNEPDSYAYEPRFTYAERRWKFVRRVLIFLGLSALIIVVGAVLWQGIEVFLLVFTGLILAVLFRGLASLLSQYTPISKTWAVAVVLLAIAAIIGGSVWLALPSIQQESFSLARQLPESFANLRQRILQYPQGEWIVNQFPQNPMQIVGSQSANLFGRITGFFSTFLGGLVNVLIVIVTAIYFAFSPQLYIEGTIKLFPASKQERAREVLSALGFTLRSWIIGRTIVGIINGSLTTLGLWYLGVPFAIPLGVLAGLLNAVPNIGPILAGIPAVLIALPQGFTTVGYVILLYFFVQSFEGFVLSPLVQQRTISLPPVLVLSGQLLLGILFGFLGVLVAVPAVAVIYVLIQMLYVEDVLGNQINIRAEKKALSQLKES